MNIRQWLDRTIVIDSETATAIKRVRLISAVDGSTWETWEAPFPAHETFASEVELVLGQLAEEFPVKRVGMMLVAEDTQGTCAQCPLSVLGKNKQAGAGLLNDGGGRALAEGMDHIVRTVERVLSTANTQLKLVGEHNEKLMAANQELLEFIKAKEENQALNAAASAEVTGQLSKAVIENMPLLMQLFQQLAGPKLGKALNGVASVAASAATGTPQ